jgi:hypothetical protein
MTVQQAFADIALNFSAIFGAGFWDVHVIGKGTPVYDDGGSIVTPGTPVIRSCSAQVDAATEAMRLADGFTEADRRILVLSATLDGEITTDERIQILDGPFAGTWGIESVTRDPAAIYWELRGRRS